MAIRTKLFRLSALMIAGTALLCAPGCVFAAAVGGAAESFRRTGSSTIPAEYTEIAGRSFAVVVQADRLIQSEEPGIVRRLTRQINDRIALNAGASHGIPSDALLAVLYNTPQWPAMPPGEVAAMLGVERLVWIELTEYRLHEPGNEYVYDGAAVGSVLVYAADSPLPDDPVFDRGIAVRFPDSSGFIATDLPAAAVTTELSSRFINRVAWLFYEHEESNVIPY
ncbi:MAG: hypothetical protein AAF356_12710 [Planctomycetota bacterium]